MNKRNWLASAGLIYAAVWIIGLLIESGSPTASASNAELRAYFASHQQVHVIQAYLIDGIAGIAILVFSASVASLFQKFGGENQTLANIVLGAGSAAASISLVQAGLQQVLANQDFLASGDAPLQTLLILINQIDTFKLLALALLIIATSALVFRTHAFPMWHGWLGIVLSIMLILGGLSFTLSNSNLFYVLFISLPLLLFWIGAVSVAILKRVE